MPMESISIIYCSCQIFVKYFFENFGVLWEEESIVDGSRYAMDDVPECERKEVARQVAD
jgi:hypothetical protein